MNNLDVIRVKSLQNNRLQAQRKSSGAHRAQNLKLENV